VGEEAACPGAWIVGAILGGVFVGLPALFLIIHHTKRMLIWSWETSIEKWKGVITTIERYRERMPASNNHLRDTNPDKGSSRFPGTIVKASSRS